MKTTKEFKINLTVCIVFIILDFLQHFIFNKIAPVNLYLTTTFSICFIVIYILNYNFGVQLLAIRKYGYYFIFFIGIFLTFMGLRFLLEEIILLKLTGLHNYKDGFSSIYVYDSIYYTFRISMYSSVTYLLIRYTENRKKISKLTIETEKAKLAALKSQINPHFLFNILNSFYEELIDDKPDTADDILKLSKLLRYVTYESTTDFVFLEKEIDFTTNYLHFYKRRYEDSFFIDFSVAVAGDRRAIKIPSLILLHFVENVCKHGIINNCNKPAKISITTDTTSIILYTENHINHSEKHTEKGIGTDNITKRLNLFFNEDFKLNNSKKNNIFKSKLSIPIKK